MKLHLFLVSPFCFVIPAKAGIQYKIEIIHFFLDPGSGAGVTKQGKSWLSTILSSFKLAEATGLRRGDETRTLRSHKFRNFFQQRLFIDAIVPADDLSAAIFIAITLIH